MSHFGYIGHHLIVAIIDHIPNGIQWLGDVQWGHLMTYVIVSPTFGYNIAASACFDPLGIRYGWFQGLTGA